MEPVIRDGKGVLPDVRAGGAPCTRVLPAADCLPTKASAEPVAIRPVGFFELHLVRAWHAQAAESFAGPFRDGHPRSGIGAWAGRGGVHLPSRPRGIANPISQTSCPSILELPWWRANEVYWQQGLIELLRQDVDQSLVVRSAGIPVILRLKDGRATAFWIS